jgi:hypothetical protein
VNPGGAVRSALRAFGWVVSELVPAQAVRCAQGRDFAATNTASAGHGTAEASPAEVSGTPPRPPSAGLPTWVNWSVPAICTVLDQHKPLMLAPGEIWCASVDQPGHRETHALFDDWQGWEEHVAPLVAQHIGYARQQWAQDQVADMANEVRSGSGDVAYILDALLSEAETTTQ